jgi:organic radical activating enzyme
VPSTIPAASSETEAALRVSEVFESVQGEGPNTGTPCLFIRLAHCNLTCAWCDTKYTWDFANYDYASEVRVVPVSELARRVQGAASAHLVITGGEPLLQQRRLVELCAALDPGVFIEVETNGTVPPLPALSARIDQWNVSPKLAHAGDEQSLRIRPAALTAFRDTGRAWLKLVVDSAADLVEIAELVSQLNWPKNRVLLMPQAATRDELGARFPEVQSWAAERGFGCSTRLHVELWGGRRGV